MGTDPQKAPGAAFPDWPALDAQFPPTHEVRAAVIADEFTIDSLKFEWEQELITPANWHDVLSSNPPDLLFVEAAWHGNNDAWQYQIVGRDAPGPDLRALVRWCRKHDVPTVFWANNEPSDVDQVTKAASLFDVVFTTDSDAIARFEGLGVPDVALLPYAAQPVLHNPQAITHRHKVVPREDVAFAGMYFAHRFPARKEQMNMLFDAVRKPGVQIGTKLDIFSRQPAGDPRYQFPAEFTNQVRGTLPYSQMLTAYRAYKAFLNVHSEADSPTVVSRRSFEIPASGAPLVELPTRGVNHFFTDAMVAKVRTSDEAARALNTIISDAHFGDHMAYVATQEIWLKHRYEHRVNEVLRHVDLGELATRAPRVSAIIASKRRFQVERVLGMLAEQRGVELQVLFGTHGFPATQILRNLAASKGLNVQWLQFDPSESLGAMYNAMIERADGDFVAKIDDDDFYDSTYLLDAAMAHRYSGSELVGKRATFVYLKDTDQMLSCFEGDENRFVHEVAGPTIFTTRDLAREVRFEHLSTGEDSDFLRRGTQAGSSVYATSRFGFVRYRGSSSHTWAAANSTFEANGSFAHPGGPSELELPAHFGLVPAAKE
ncbi:spore maturation protein CgeB [Arcanobacterium wilhelmae]|uniref:Spore maturation protein CgeB n=2 Tax=Arcanobacterium wilhelmae TaxID=1803177 RepID=A0ABT9NC08_9ACTO|nr:glycosyltransferase [Arcanobacterium wilhelmae]MDP9801235.1 spore maturation protein CgeB [Arcanobacterium wilhelmae]